MHCGSGCYYVDTVLSTLFIIYNILLIYLFKTKKYVVEEVN